MSTDPTKVGLGNAPQIIVVFDSMITAFKRFAVIKNNDKESSQQMNGKIIVLATVLSLLTWAFFFMTGGDSLDLADTTIVTGFFLVIIFIIRQTWVKIRNGEKNDKSEKYKG